MATPVSIRSSGHPTYSCTVCPAKRSVIVVNMIPQPVSLLLFTDCKGRECFHRRLSVILFTICPWLLGHCSTLLQCGRNASYGNAFLLKFYSLLLKLKKILFSCASEVHMIVMHEPEGSVRQGHLNPVYIPDVEVSHFWLTA